MFDEITPQILEIRTINVDVREALPSPVSVHQDGGMPGNELFAPIVGPVLGKVEGGVGAEAGAEQKDMGICIIHSAQRGLVTEAEVEWVFGTYLQSLVSHGGKGEVRMPTAHRVRVGAERLGNSAHTGGGGILNPKRRHGPSDLFPPGYGNGGLRPGFWVGEVGGLCRHDERSIAANALLQRLDYRLFSTAHPAQ